LKLTSLLAGILSLVLIAGLGTPAFAGPGGFSGDYDPSKWTFSTAGEGEVSTVFAPDKITLFGSDAAGLECFPPFGNGECRTAYEVPILCAGAGIVNFDWNYSTMDEEGPGPDPMGFLINGVGTQLTDGDGPNSQSGSESVPVQSGDVFGFYVDAGDNDFGGAGTTFSEFSVICTECGNGMVEPPEACDDGNTTPGDGCSDICLNEVCSVIPPMVLVTLESGESTMEDKTFGCEGILPDVDEIDTSDCEPDFSVELKPMISFIVLDPPATGIDYEETITNNGVTIPGMNTCEIKWILSLGGQPYDEIPQLIKITVPGDVPVGGIGVPIETTSLLLASAQSFSWMIPVVLTGIGIGLFVVSRKSEKND